MKKSPAKTTLLILFFIGAAVVTLLPLALLFVASLRPGQELMRNGLNFNIDWKNANLDEYRYLFSGNNAYFTWYINSLIVTVVQVGLALILSSFVGYGFAMYEFKGKNLSFMLVLLVMMVPTEVIILPLYRLIIRLGLINTKAGIIVPYVVIPMLIFFFRQYLSGIPKDFVDAGRVDGCSEYGIYTRIMLPLMKPAFAAMGIYEGMASWNNLFWPMIVINYDILIAGSCFAIIPILLLFVMFQRYFIEGMTAGGVKG